ncbi:unnamed protein product [Lactuca virosa]|uniref:DUF4283 domain-containing protein n=1 Tax=Lactuca virosa TaxID=75947 RepID=A0AAU9PU57_9ASTR|nr:unnamed protein product [Lactuca virosa]
MCDLWIGCYHVFVSLAKYGRENRRMHEKTQVHVNIVGGGSNKSRKLSYANVMKVDTVKSNKAGILLNLEGKDIVNDLALKPSVFCQVRSVRLIPKLFLLLKEEGFHEIQIKYLGGDWVYVEFESELVCAKFKKSSSVGAYFSNFRHVVNGFKVLERVVWIEILGLPCCAWNDSAVNKVAGLWGEVCFLDDDNQAPLAIKRVCIKTMKPSLIHDKLSLVVQGITYEVVVRELSNWEPNILCSEEALDCDIPSLSDDVEKGGNDFDDGVAEEEGEMTPRGKVKPINMENDNAFGMEQDYGFKPVPVDVHVTESADGDAVPLGDEVRVPDPIDTAADPIDTGIGPTVEVVQRVGEENDSTESLSQPPGFRRDVEMEHGNSKIKCNSASSHGSSRLLKKWVPDDIEDISDIVKQYFEMGKLLGYDMEGNKDKVKQILASIGVI